MIAYGIVRQIHQGSKTEINIDSIIQELRNLKLTIEGKTVSALEILHKLQGELGRGIQKHETTRAIVEKFGGSITSEQLTLSGNEVFDKLNILGIIELKPRREYSGPHPYDADYWFLASLGKKVINSIKWRGSA